MTRTLAGRSLVESFISFASFEAEPGLAVNVFRMISMVDPPFPLRRSSPEGAGHGSMFLNPARRGKPFPGSAAISAP